MISFTAILWNLSGPLTLPISASRLPRAMFWIGIVYVLFATVIAFWIGKPIIWLVVQQREVQRRLPLRAGAVARRLRGGRLLPRRGRRAHRAAQTVRPVVANYKRYVNRMIGFYGWNLSMSQIIVPLPYVLQFPRFFSGEITLGAHDPVRVGVRPASRTGCRSSATPTTPFAGYRAAIIRLHGLVIANEEGRALPEITTDACVDGTVELKEVEVRTPDGKQLINPLDLRLEVGDTLVVTGESGSGKTTLLRSLAELWPFTSGTLTRPCGPNETMFLSQMPVCAAR